jgi:hypothetical protein
MASEDSLFLNAAMISHRYADSSHSVHRSPQREDLLDAETERCRPERTSSLTMEVHGHALDGWGR